MVVKRIDVFSVAKMYGAMCAVVGLLIGIFFALASVVGAGLADTGEVPFFAPLLGVGAVIAAPIFYGVMGLIGGAVGAVVYNVFAAMVGGVRIEVE